MPAHPHQAKGSSCVLLCPQVTDGIFQRLEKCVVMLGRGMSVQHDVETAFAAVGLLDDTPQQKPGLRVNHIFC